MTDSVKFDPGIGELVIDFNNYINDIYSKLLNLHSIHQKKAHFKIYVNKIYNAIENNIAFYKGCLLWAYYIKCSNNLNPKEIDGNFFLNLTQEQKDEYDYMLQVNFLENYFDSFERDTAYYLGKKMVIPDSWRKILSLYSDFLSKNNGFVNTKLTSDIILPDEISELKYDLSAVNMLIEKAINLKDLSLFLKDEKIVI